MEALLTIAVYTGLHEGELLGLKWQDIGWDTVTVTVQRTLTRARPVSLCCATRRRQLGCVPSTWH